MNAGFIAFNPAAIKAPACCPGAAAGSGQGEAAKGVFAQFAASLGAALEAQGAAGGAQGEKLFSETMDSDAVQADPLDILRQAIMQIASNGVVALPQNPPQPADQIPAITVHGAPDQQDGALIMQGSGVFGLKGLLNATMPNEVPTVQGDTSKSGQMLQNLFTQSMEATGQDNLLPQAVPQTGMSGKEHMADSLQLQAASAEEADGAGQILKTAAESAGGDRIVKDAGGSPVILQNIVVQPSPMEKTEAAAGSVPVSRLADVAEAMSKAAGAGDRQLVIRIDPPDLGTITIKLVTDNGVLKADVRVDSSAVKDMFALAMPQIRNTLEQSGIRMGEFLVDLRDDRDQSGQGRREEQARQEQHKNGNNQSFSDFFA